ncbi:unnamed protein product [Bursaphelenchus xylophilus]|uniref:(pine wood nematode) hypothetical protein n=1 Tax=Bursaphelenchus xylophilus TaxID=6326 RepID=A0A1I7S8Z6_BURXY|nr:unnamed protein product [Bursaphelenchus xylophilus]CAG9086059.1 unnamed protein product [Bursaphelenchus xylophilus]
MSARSPDFYKNKVILAPMVKAGRTPFRALCSEYGADLVYTEEIVDQKFLQCTRTRNDILNTIDYFLDDELVLRIAKEEKERCILQIGSNSEHGCILVSKKIGDDVAGIDVNMGCPKPFSISGGMGAALLKKPELVQKMISSLVSVSKIPVTCKIRMLDTLEDTIKFAKMLESCGISALGVHGRRRDERQQHKNRSEEVKAVADALSIPVIANGESGNISKYEDIKKCLDKCGASSIMIARKALNNPSIFRKEGVLPMEKEIQDFLEKACTYDEPYTTVKYSVQRMLGSQQEFDPRGKKTLDALTVGEICAIWGKTAFYDGCKEQRQRMTLKRHHTEKENELEKEGIVVSDLTFPPKRLKANHGTLSPKCILLRYCAEKKLEKPIFKTERRARDGRFECVISVADKKFASRISQPNTKMAEQVACLAALHGLNIRDRLPGNWEE